MLAQQAKEIGRHYASIMVMVGLGLAVLLAALIFGRRSLLDMRWMGEFSYWLNLLVAALAFYACGWLYGGWAGQLILLRHYNAWGTGALLGVLMLVTTTFIASWAGFFQEGISSPYTTFASAFYDYIVKPLIWVTCAGILPALLAGLWFGYKLKYLLSIP